MRIGMAADVDQQGRVIDSRQSVVVQAHPPCQPHRDQALTQDMLHRLAEAQVNAEREGGDEFGEPDGRRWLGHGSHSAATRAISGHMVAMHEHSSRTTGCQGYPGGLWL